MIAIGRQGELFRIKTSKADFGSLQIGKGANKVDLTAGNEEIEAKVKELADPILDGRGWHCYAKIISRTPIEWWLWAGPKNIEPRVDWFSGE